MGDFANLNCESHVDFPMLMLETSSAFSSSLAKSLVSDRLLISYFYIIKILPYLCMYLERQDALWETIIHLEFLIEKIYIHNICVFSQFSHLMVSDSLRPHGLQHTRLPPSITKSQSLLKLMSIRLLMPSNHLILCCPRLVPPSIFPSIRVFSNESILCIRWPKYRSFSFHISPSNEYSGLISFRVDCFDLLAVQGTLTNLPWHSVQKHQFFSAQFSLIVQLSHPYMTTGKTIALTRWTFVGKVVSLLLNILSRLVTAFLPRSKCL